MNIKTLGLLVIPATCYFMVACSSDSAPAVPLETPIGDISGGWSIFEVAISSNTECSGTSGYDITIVQSDNTITATSADGGKVSGSLSDDALKLSGTRPEGVGTVTYSSITGTVAADCSSMNLKTTWSYAETGFSCSGTGTMELNRTSGGTSC